VEVVLALLSALMFALGSMLQQKAGTQAPADGASGRLLLRMARRPVWLAGIACDGLGFVAQAAALKAGRLDVVQPLLVTSVVFALPLGAWLSGQRVSHVDVGAAVAIVIALAAFMAIADPSGGSSDASISRWVIAGAACCGICAALVALARARPARGGGRRAALLGIGAGILFGLSAALTKAVVDRLDGGLMHTILSWEVPALIVVGYASMTVNQMSLDAGALAASVGASTAFDPIASVVLGLTLFGEVLNSSAVDIVATCASLSVALAGMLLLARSQPDVATAAGP
jgi:drug/metabolite transporter (DMT)-like permease